MRSKLTPNLVASCRAQFPALQRQVDDQEAIYFDAPAGTQVPRCVIDAVTDYLTHHNANHDGLFATSRESDDILRQAHQAVADLLGTAHPECIVFGPNMTTLTLALSRALARDWTVGDEILVTRLEHDANFTPWVLAASDVGATVRYVDIHPRDTTLDVEDFRHQLTDRTRLIAVTCASNATGSLTPVRQLCRWAREAGALSCVDAVHFAPHRLIDVTEMGCDFLVCSAYKFFGPHVGILWGRPELLSEIQPYKLRPSPDSLPGKWMTGTQNHEGIAGTAAAVDYLANLGRALTDQPEITRRQALQHAFQAISVYEQDLARQLLDGLSELPDIRVWGITDAQRAGERLPTVAITHRGKTPAALAQSLADRGIFVWHGNYYALPLTERLGVEPEGMVRIGMVHYNTPAEVDRLLKELHNVAQG